MFYHYILNMFSFVVNHTFKYFLENVFKTHIFMNSAMVEVFILRETFK